MLLKGRSKVRLRFFTLVLLAHLCGWPDRGASFLQLPQQSYHHIPWVPTKIKWDVLAVLCVGAAGQKKNKNKKTALHPKSHSSSSHALTCEHSLLDIHTPQIPHRLWLLSLLITWAYHCIDYRETWSYTADQCNKRKQNKITSYLQPTAISKINTVKFCPRRHVLIALQSNLILH